MKLSFSWLGTRKTLSAEQKSQAAESFGAEGEFLSAGKKLLDTSHPKFKAVNSVRSNATAFFRGCSLPFPEPGIRLVRRDELDSIVDYLSAAQTELADAVSELERDFDQLKSSARNRLGSLFDSGDYPDSLADAFSLSWEFPSVEPPPYLRRLAPELYREECQRVQARFNQAVGLAEQAFIEELARLVEHLNERLSGSDDGRPKVFRDSAITNFAEFFERFQRLNIGSNEQLEDLVQQAQQIVGGVVPQHLRDSDQMRRRITDQLAGVNSTSDSLLIERPRRNIQRSRRS